MPFKPGQSGNPAGRKPGAVGTKNTKLREQIAAAVPEIIEKLQEQAKQGDTAAAKILLDRTIPTLKPSDQPVALPIGGDLGMAARAVLDAMMNGAVTPDQAASVAAVLASIARVKEVTELEGRIAALEAGKP